MLILAVITGIIIWRIVIYCQQDKDDEPSEPVSMRTKLKQTVVKYKIYIAVGSCISSILGGLWIYFMYIHPLLGHKLSFHFEAHWEIGTRESWAAHFEMLTMSEKLDSKPCPHFSRDNFIKILENFNNISKDQSLHETLQRLTVSRPPGVPGMYNDEGSYPVILLETSVSNYQAVREFIRSREQVLIKKFPNLKLLIFDMGLTFQQKYKLLNCSQCEIVENLPDIRVFYWTPVLVYLALQRFDSVVWLDPASDLDNDTLHNILQKTETEEIQIVLKKDLPRKWPESKILKTLTNQEKVSTFDILLTEDEKEADKRQEMLSESQIVRMQNNLSPGNNEGCLKLVPTIKSDIISIKQNNFTTEAIVRPWVFCALSGRCVPNDNCRPFHSYDIMTQQNCDRTHQVLKRILVSLFNDMYVNFYYNH